MKVQFGKFLLATIGKILPLKRHSERSDGCRESVCCEKVIDEYVYSSSN